MGMFETVILIMAAGISASVAIGSLFKYFEKGHEKEESFEKRVETLTKSLNEAVQLISNIESEINARSTIAEKLKNDVDKYKSLAALKESEAEAVVQMIKGEFGRHSKKSFWSGVLINFIFFILGAGTSGLIALILR